MKRRSSSARRAQRKKQKARLMVRTEDAAALRRRRTDEAEEDGEKRLPLPPPLPSPPPLLPTAAGRSLLRGAIEADIDRADQESIELFTAAMGSLELDQAVSVVCALENLHRESLDEWLDVLGRLEHAARSRRVTPAGS